MNGTLIAKIVLSMVPIIVAGIANMAFVKSAAFAALKAPIDRGCVWRDGKPLFGPNKTWKGALGMIFFSALAMLLFRIALNGMISQWTIYNGTGYNGTMHPFSSPLMEGALLGFAYVIFELPNSFIKRRLNIAAGANDSGFSGAFFTVIDQADSVFGCAVVLLFITSITLTTAALVVVIGAAIHLIVNALLYSVGLKKQAR